MKAFRSGSPFETEAVLAAAKPASFLSIDQLPDFQISRDGENTVLTALFEIDDALWGLGKNVGSVNRRGMRFALYNRSDPSHTPDKIGLYGSLPFLIVSSLNRSYGIFIDYPSRISIDAGFTQYDKLVISIPSSDFDLYLFDAAPAREIIREFLSLVGPPVRLPAWSFGYHQCRYSYPDAQTVEELATKFRELKIPCDALYLDIDYMDQYKIFTVDEKAFPNLPELAGKLRQQGFKIVSIIDPGIKVEPGYEIYDQAVANDFCCVTGNGEPFVGAVWPGLTVFPDFLRPEVRDWWGSLYRETVEAGIEGFWNDMNEPEIMYTPESLAGLKTSLSALMEKSDLGSDPVGELPALWQWWNNPRFWDEFYHRGPDGSLIPHQKIHNLYGSLMARATSEGVAKLRPNRRSFVLSRASYPGMHRHSIVWTGDNHSWWDHMKLHIQMMISLNMGGFFCAGADVGGHSGEPSPELLVRWTQLGVFSPFFRNHTVKHSRPQEPWAFGEDCTGHTRNAITLRYSLLPYLYSEYVRCSRELTPFVAPLFLDFDSSATRHIEDQFFLGDTLMVCPVITQSARGRFVHLPRGKWLHWNATTWDSREFVLCRDGNPFIEASLGQIPLFLRENRLLVLTEPTQYVGEFSPAAYIVCGLVTDQAAFTITIDDGDSLDFQNGAFTEIHLHAESVAGTPVGRVTSTVHAGFPISGITIHFELYDGNGVCHQSSVTL